MGTRHIIAVKLEGEYKIAQYGQWNGYPYGQGQCVLLFLKGYIKDNFILNLRKCSFFTVDDFENLIKEYDAYTQWDEFYEKFPQLSRNLGADILSLVYTLPEDTKELKLRNEIEFLGDSLMCEWAYVIDFDTNTFEIFEGFNKEPLTESDRFFNIPYNHNSGCINYGYQQVKLLCKWDLDNLPSIHEMLNTCNELIKDQEEDVT